jgi:serine/threonine-protein kinase
MITGDTPFRGEYEQAVSYSIVNEAPKPPSAHRPEVPAGLDSLVMNALAKSPAERYQSAEEMRADLESCAHSLASVSAPGGATGHDRLPSIAVLPFKDMSPQQDQEYFCEGIAEELLNDLVQIEGLRVAARTSSEQFKNKGMDVRAKGRELGVQSILEGSVRKSGDRLRITAQLINVEDGYHLFSEKYDRTAEDIFAIQDEIALAVVDRLKVRLLRGDRSKLIKRHTENEEAYRLYLQGRYFWNRRHEGGLQRGIECFGEAIAIDPEYALPYSGVADCYYDFGWYDYLPPREAFGKCKKAAMKALELDPDLAEAHASLAVALQFFDWDWVAAEAEFKRAIELNPKYASAHHFHSMFLAGVGKCEEAIAEAKRARDLDPIQPVIRLSLGWNLYCAGRHVDAAEHGRAMIEFDPNFFAAWIVLGLASAELGRYTEAEEAIEKGDVLAGGTSTLVLGIKGQVAALAGKREEARAILDRMLALRSSRYVSALLISSIYSNLGETDLAFEWLERAFEERDHWLVYARTLSIMRLMCPDPRFQAIMSRLRLDALP